MEADVGVKAPVTRLRRRLSVEQSDDTRSPSAPSTPTKKRAGRLTAKPQLELINENVSQNSPKRATRKSISRDIAEPEEKALTPARRSIRIKSNTSIVSETPVQSFDSPRAMRAAARRNSQLGSDNEASTTPARTRRTRKDSTSSLDKQTTPASAIEIATTGRTTRTRKDSTSSIDKHDETVEATNKPLITEVIAEEPENNLTKSASTDDITKNASNQSSPGSLRKSPRLKAKKGRNSQSSAFESIDNQSQDSNDHVTSTSAEANDKDTDKTEPLSAEGNNSLSKKNYNELGVESNIVEKEKLSMSSADLINDMDVKPKNKKSSLNKSASAVTLTTEFKNKRHRTKSCTTLPMTPPTDGHFYSDNESSKKKLKKQENIFSIKRISNQTGSGDSPDHIKETNCGEEISVIALNTSSKKKNKRSETNKNNSMNESTLTKANLDQSSMVTPKGKDNEMGSEIENNKENLFGKRGTLDFSPTKLLFEKAPTGIIKSIVFIEDSDTETGFKTHKEKQLSGGDQCVPVVYQDSSPKKPAEDDFNVFNNTKENIKNNETCEPMDIDETMPENVSLTEYSHEDKLEKTSRKSSISIEVENNANESTNKSKRKSSISNSMSQDLEKTGNDNKSTLILSQIKDMSSIENGSKSPKESKAETLSKSINIPDVTKDDLINKNISLTYSTSTPVQQNKYTKKSAVEINTSVITPNNMSKSDMKDILNKSNKKNVSMSSKSSKCDSADEDSEEVSSDDANDMLDDEAEDAGDDYQSGDSQDEEERQYEEEHEVLEKGETLDSDDEISNDSDYEKDSFLVSSDEEDNDLLSGSGNDLEMSDNELTMSAKSKKKYNERKQKEQKKASREMFEARHNDSDKSEKPKPRKNKRLRLDSTLLHSDDDNRVPPKKNKRMRLNSSITKSDAEEQASNNKSNSSIIKIKSEEIGYKKKKCKRLSESIYDDNANNEKEITVVDDDNIQNDDPLLVKVKPEPKTPQKDLSISTILINDMEEVEEVQVENNVSMMKPNDTRDPLQAEDNSDMSSISENEEITKNYESVLAHLNNENKVKNIKSCDTSLNLNKKAKKTADIVDELNLAQIKPNTKEPKNTEPQNIKKHTVKELSNDDDESSSDGIDIKLLFSDDSSDSNDANKKVNEGCENVENIIPLRRTEGKTDLRKSLNSSKVQEYDDILNISKKKNKKNDSLPNEEITESNTNEVIESDNVLNVSNKKKQKKRHTSQNEENVATGDLDDGCENINFFIDTTGTHVDLDTSANVSNISSKKKNKKNSISSENEHKESTDAVDSVDIPLEVSIQSSKKKKIKKSIESSKEIKEQSINIPEIKTPKSEKKKNRTSESQDLIDSESTDAVDSVDIPLEVSIQSSKKKKIKKSIESSKEIKEQSINIPEIKTPKSEKKKNRTSEYQDLIDSEFTDAVDSVDIPLEVSIQSSKKKKIKKSMESSKEIKEQSINIPEIKTPKSEKKKKRTSESQDLIDSETILSTNILKNTSPESSKLINHNSEKSISGKTSEDKREENKTGDIDETVSSSKKRKRKSSANLESLSNDTSEKNNSSKSFLDEGSESQKKKRKISHNDEDKNIRIQFQDTAIVTPQKPVKSHLEEKKNSKTIFSVDDKAAATEATTKSSKVTDIEKMTANKKRKERDNDNCSKITKVRKQNSCDKIHVPRLPTTILNQLDDKPCEEILEMKKLKIVSTTEFMVEETRRRRTKPSHYLEESVYLNDDESLEVKKQKTIIKKPKVLPFTPTASTSDSGFTTHFQVNVIPEKIEFVARRADVAHFKNDYLQDRKMKKMRTYDLYKHRRNVKLSKY